MPYRRLWFSLIRPHFWARRGALLIEINDEGDRRPAATCAIEHWRE